MKNYFFYCNQKIKKSNSNLNLREYIEMLLRTRKYLELDSTYRNRKQYPLPSDFAVPFHISGSYNNCIEAFDPVCCSAPFEQSTSATTTVTLTSPNTMTLVPLVSSAIDNFYINYYIGLIDVSVTPALIQYSKISYYKGSTRVATTLGNLTLPLGTYSYVIRKQLPAEIPYNTNTELSNIIPMTLLVAFTPTQLTLPPSTAPENAYQGMTIRLISFAPYMEEYQNIVSYDSTTFTVTVSRPFSSVFTSSDYYELLPFSRDNVRPLKSQGSQVNQATSYSVRLCSISIPKIVRSYTDVAGVKSDEMAVLQVANGGTIDQYPYYYVCLYSDVSRDAIQPFLSNNPNSSYATFRVVDGRCDMSPIIKFLPNDTFHMTIILPNGEVLSFIQKDTQSPKEPLYRLQISALFEFTRMDDK